MNNVINKKKYSIVTCTNKNEIQECVKYIKKQILNYFKINNLNYDFIKNNQRQLYQFAVNYLNTPDSNTDIFTFKLVINVSQKIHSFSINKITNIIYLYMINHYYQVRSVEHQWVKTKKYKIKCPSHCAIFIARIDGIYHLVIVDGKARYAELCYGSKKGIQELFNMPFVVSALIMLVGIDKLEDYNEHHNKQKSSLFYFCKNKNVNSKIVNVFFKLHGININVK